MLYTSNYALKKLLEIREFYVPESTQYRRLTAKALAILVDECVGTSIVPFEVTAFIDEATELLDSSNVKSLCSTSQIQYDQGTGEEASKSSEPKNG